MLPYVAVVVVVLFIAAAFAVDVASMHMVRSELRTATDAAARAGVEALGRTQSTNEAIDAALRIAEENIVAAEGLKLDRDQIVLGTSGQSPDGTFFFQPNQTPFNSVRVIGERTAGSPSGPVSLFFAPVLGFTDFQPVQSATATRIDRDIALVLDVSGSMSINNRFGALQNALNVFLAELDQTPQDERLSLTVYSTRERKLVNLTPDLGQIRNAFASETPNGFTAIGRGLDRGLDSIQNDPGARAFSLKSIIVMTDGNQNRGVPPDVIARKCKRAGVVVHTITFSQGANQALMKQVADIADGIHLHADNDQQLLDAFGEIARQLQVLLIE